MAKLGIKPSRRVKFKTIEGRVVERGVGHLFIEWNGETAPTPIVFAEEGDQTVIGLHALESLGLEVDPVTRELRKSEALLAL
jgi:predicted aspartyl protease